MRIKHLARINPSKSECDGLKGDQLVSFIPMDSIGMRGEIDATATKALDEVREGYTYVADGDVLLAKITPCFENGKCAVAVGLVGGIGFATTEVIPIRPVSRDDARFLYYLLTSEPFRTKATAEMYGAGGQKRVPERFVREYQAELPRATSRQAISDFLDHETARIDTLIAKQKQLIELLKEKRQTVISQAVTKGLDPNVPMKDSGVEWLGEVPAHWMASRMKWKLTRMDQGWSPQCDGRVPAPDEYGVLKVGAVNGGIFRETESKALPIHESPRLEYLIQANDLLVSRANTRELVGSAAVVTQSSNFLMLCDKLYRIHYVRAVLPQYVAFYLGIKIVRNQIELGASGASASMQNIGQGTLRDLTMPLPPIKEQEAILSFLKSTVSRFDTLEQKARDGVAMLSERRTALISAAVTGQIDVTTYDAFRTDAASAA